ncbi:hypothetical protein [Bacillus paranthracis]|uniref:hypothetical protein n=1 Tax=Bacillus paranthracis TaxID=2026186 RepID=UPI0013D4B64F|nr:hypothetical protein [Bacillus paranthracis]
MKTYEVITIKNFYFTTKANSIYDFSEEHVIVGVNSYGQEVLTPMSSVAHIVEKKEIKEDNNNG